MGNTEPQITKYNSFPAFLLDHKGKNPHLTMSAKRVIVKPSETGGQGRLPASSTSSEPTETHHQSPYGASVRCFALLSLILHPKRSIRRVVSSLLRAPGEQPQQIPSKVLPSTTGGTKQSGSRQGTHEFPIVEGLLGLAGRRPIS